MLKIGEEFKQVLKNEMLGLTGSCAVFYKDNAQLIPEKVSTIVQFNKTRYVDNALNCKQMEQ